MNLEQMIISKINPSWSLLEKARFIYIELGKLVTFSTKFQNTDAKGYADLYVAKVSIYKLDSLEVNCRMWAQLYSQLLYRAEIPNKTVGQGHTWVEFYVDGETYVADATCGGYTDLSRIKNNDVTTGFGRALCQNKERVTNSIQNNIEWIQTLNRADRNIGYNIDKREELLEFKTYLEEMARGNVDLKELAHTDVEDPITFKLEYLFSHLRNMNDGYYESKDFVHELVILMMSAEERLKVGAVELKRTNSDKSVSIIQCIYTKHNEEPSYYLLAPNLPVQKFSAEDVLSLAKKGYGIESKTIPGMIYSQKFIPGKKSESLSYRLYKKFSPSKTPIDEYAEQSSMIR